MSRFFHHAVVVMLALWPVLLKAEPKQEYRNLPAAPDTGLSPKVGEQLPLNARWKTPEGETSRFGDFFGEGPPVLVLPGYARCTMLCGPSVETLANKLQDAGLKVGKDYRFVFVSIDPEEPATASAELQKGFDRITGASASDRAFLRSDAATIEQLMQRIGIEYRYVPENGEFAHPSVLVAVTPDGTIADYQSGIASSAEDLRAALKKARATVESPENQPVPVLLGCFHYDPETGTYTVAVEQLFRIGGVSTAVILGAVIVWFRRRERRGQ